MRLNAAVKKQITANAVHTALKNDKLAVRQGRAALAERVRVEMFGGQEKLDELLDIELKAISMANIVGAKFGFKIAGADLASYVELSCGGFIHRLQYNGKSEPIHHKRRLTPHSNRMFCDVKHPIAVEAKRLADLQESISQRQLEIEASVKPVLGQAGTSLKKLIKAWPEVEALLPEVEALLPVQVAPRTTAVAVPTAKLNQLIGLPK
jgi:hypothetical protein